MAREATGHRRPRLGLTLLTLAGLLIIWMPLVIYIQEFGQFSLVFGGVVIGGIVLGSAVLGWIYPQRVQVFGVIGLIFSILSLVGALGGLVIGMLLGIVGGSLCAAWSPKKEPPGEGAEPSGD
ncbi:conserved hypothetical protein [Rubrobacter xylanophilus DSM 9941]|uniref:Uncharacterized protein n=1 Tax=Rubrobacter xylanophilus (strain DSM 9941 / JCM 11954 / NBRC 16129 / PRD-1) TaxID=266117 RepID=Q1ATA3_RUBXD|nr:DUF6114 domain-containing protein [Rubrobacter xylanophilus]ABG05375.1 conserved hypothetical protein [Rubrobacter xylanophilus DSM 9941]